MGGPLIGRWRRFWTAALLAPALLLVTIDFVIPVLAMLVRGVTETEVPHALPRAAAALRRWDGRGLPDDRLAATIAADLTAARDAGTLSLVANRLNHDVAGSRSLILATARRLPDDRSVGLADLAAIDERWASPATWASLRHAAGPLTSFYLLAAADRRLDPDGRVVPVPPGQAIFVDVVARTLAISAVVTALSLVLGYPVAYLLATAPERWAAPMMLLVLLPFWTSVLVRTTAWAVLLQTHGVINGALLDLGLIAQPLALVYNRTGVLIAMTHVLLPFMILALIGVMAGIPRDAMRAARSLGAGRLRAFVRIYLPLSLPGVAAGTAIVFALALGYYITPAIVGGGGDQMLSSFIAFYINQSLNWGLAAALSLLLLAIMAAALGVWLAFRRAAVT